MSSWFQFLHNRGKGFNVARALKTLGEAALVVAPAGGLFGKVLNELAAQEGLDGVYVQTSGETRTCLTIIDEANRTTEINERGSSLAQNSWEILLHQIELRLASARYLVVSGSFPPGFSEQNLKALFKAAKHWQVPVLLDTYGTHLSYALDLEPALVKINHHEASDIVGWPISDPADAAQAARELQKRGAKEIIITLGKNGAVGVDANNQSFGCSAPEVNGICAVGSGDAFLAGVIASLSQNNSFPQALRWGVAAGAANTLKIGAGIFSKADFEKLLQNEDEVETI